MGTIFASIYANLTMRHHEFKFFSIIAFYTQRPGDYFICLSGQKMFSYLVCCENLAKYSRLKGQTDRTEQYAIKEEYIK